MIRIRGGAGLGDALYLRAVVEHFIAAGEQVEICSDYPSAFTGTGARTAPFRRTGIDVLAHYASRKARRDSNQWQDICGSAGIWGAPFRFKPWTVQNRRLVADLRAAAGDRPLVLVHGGWAPMDRHDRFGAELLPAEAAFDAVLGALWDCYLVRIGRGRPAYAVRGDRDLTDATTVPDLLDLGSVCDGAVGQCSYLVPLAEGFAKPALFLWSWRGQGDGVHEYVRQITPAKVLSAPSSHYVWDDLQATPLAAAARRFRMRLTPADIPFGEAACAL